MRSPSADRRVHRVGASAVLAAALLFMAATPAAAAGPGAYAIVPGTGTFTTLTTNDLAPGGASGGELFYLSTTATGVHHLPFPLHLFNQFYKNIAVGSYGNVQPGVTTGGGSSALPSECLPTSTFGKPAVMVLWGELVFGTGANGIYTRTRGSAPHRTFMISWQGVFAVSAPTTANAQVTFREDSQNLTFVYGATTFQHLVIVGIQSKQQLTWAQRYCFDSRTYPTNGTKLTLTHSG